MSLRNCYNFEDFRKLAKKKLPAPIFHYIDGGSDDEITLNRNTEAFSKCDLVPNILASVGEPDMSTEVFGKKIKMPLFLSPVAMQRLFHHDGAKLVQELQKNSIHFIVCPLWQPLQSKRFQMYLEGQKCFKYTYTKQKV